MTSCNFYIFWTPVQKQHFHFWQDTNEAFENKMMQESHLTMQWTIGLAD